MSRREIVSRHLFRRTARNRERFLERAYPDRDYRVESTIRGPVGWQVVRTR